MKTVIRWILIVLVFLFCYSGIAFASKFILEKARQHGLDVNAPFPFLLEGSFDSLLLHVINGQNPKFGGHGNKGHLFKLITEKRNNQKAIVIGFYSACSQGV